MISENTKAVLLLTTYFSSQEVKQYRPLSYNGYGYFACWLSQNSFKPEDLLNAERFDSILALWDKPLSHINPKKTVGFARIDQTISEITYERLHALLGRGASLSLSLDKWSSAGIWIMDRQHPSYPKAIKGYLKHKSPALFFGVGSIDLLSKHAIGFVGSRDCTNNDIAMTQQYVASANQNGFQIVSGAAKGIDSEAMLASINNGETAIGILSDNLYRASGASQWRSALRNNQLVLISPFHPEASFDKANAMTRNKFIYMLSKLTIVVCSGIKGGTWEGAQENIKNGWVPLLVSTHATPLQSGNQALILKSNGNASAKSVNPVSIDSIGGQLKSNVQMILNAEEQNLELHEVIKSKVQDVSSTSTQKNLLSQADLFSNEEDDSSVEINTKTDVVYPVFVSVQRQEINLVANVFQEKNVDTIDKFILLSVFYRQIAEVIKSSSEQTITEDSIIEKYPELEILGKTALSKWLLKLVDLGVLVRPSKKKKEYKLAKSVE